MNKNNWTWYSIKVKANALISLEYQNKYMLFNIYFKNYLNKIVERDIILR